MPMANMHKVTANKGEKCVDGRQVYTRLVVSYMVLKTLFVIPFYITVWFILHISISYTTVRIVSDCDLVFAIEC